MNNPSDMLVSDERAFSDEAPFSRNIDSDHFKLNYLRDIYESELTKIRSEMDELVGEMRRHLWILQRAQADPILWEKLTVATGVATLNGYEAVLAKHKTE